MYARHRYALCNPAIFFVHSSFGYRHDIPILREGDSSRLASDAYVYKHQENPILGSTFAASKIHVEEKTMPNTY